MNLNAAIRNAAFRKSLSVTVNRIAKFKKVLWLKMKLTVKNAMESLPIADLHYRFEHQIKYKTYLLVYRFRCKCNALLITESVTMSLIVLITPMSAHGIVLIKIALARANSMKRYFELLSALWN